MIAATRPLFLPALLALGCAAAPPPPPEPVAMGIATEDLAMLAGSWRGETWSTGTGGSALVRFELDADEGGARGDVLLLPSPPRDGDHAPDPGTPGPGRLSIRFVRVDPSTETVSGTLEPYRDPDCDCVVSTTFLGRVSRDRIEGTWIAQGGGGRPARVGGWRVTRTAAPE